MLDWMAWSPPVAIFFPCIGLMLVGMAIWEVRSPTVPRKGFLPIVTTRGDRLFIGLLSAAYVNLAWLGLTEAASAWWGFAISMVLLVVVMRWG